MVDFFDRVVVFCLESIEGVDSVLGFDGVIEVLVFGVCELGEVEIVDLDGVKIVE